MTTSTPQPLISDEFKGLIPPLSDDEHKKLRASIEKDGCRDALVVWGERDILLDGHNRLSICSELGVKFTIAKKSFRTSDAAKEWVILNQLGRRNLSRKAAELLRGKLYQTRKQQVPNPEGANQHQKLVAGQSGPQPHTADRIAAETGVSPSTVKRNATFARAVERLGIEEAVLAGTEKRPVSEIIRAAKRTRLSKERPMPESCSGEKKRREPRSADRVRKLVMAYARLSEEERGRFAEKVGLQYSARTAQPAKAIAAAQDAIQVLKQIDQDDQFLAVALGDIITYCRRRGGSDMYECCE